MGKVKKVIIGVVVTALVGTGIGGGLLYVRKGSQKEVLVASVSDLAGENYGSDNTLSGNVYAIVINIFGNFFIFMPLQFFLIELFEIRKIKQNFLVCFTITFVIEIVQYIFKVGMLDVDDILLCVAGMMSFYYFYGKYRGKNKKRGM